MFITESELSLESIASTTNNNIVIETIKVAENQSDIVIRAYEDSGIATKTMLKTSLAHQKAYESDMLENIKDEINLDEISFKPFEIKTIILTREKENNERE